MKNILIGISMLVLAFYLLWEQGMQQQDLIDNSIVADENASSRNQGETRISAQFDPSSFSEPVQIKIEVYLTYPHPPPWSRERKNYLKDLPTNFLLLYSRIIQAEFEKLNSKSFQD